MEKFEIRLECLKLAHTHGRNSEEAIGRAKEYEKYVTQDEPKTESEPSTKVEPDKGQPNKGSKRSQKRNAGKPDIFS